MHFYLENIEEEIGVKITNNFPSFLFEIRYKDLASYKLSGLQQKLSESVPSSQMEVANRQYADLTAKYRDMLQKEQLHSVQVIITTTRTFFVCIYFFTNALSRAELDFLNILCSLSAHC